MSEWLKRCGLEKTGQGSEAVLIHVSDGEDRAYNSLGPHSTQGSMRGTSGMAIPGLCLEAYPLYFVAKRTTVVVASNMALIRCRVYLWTPSDEQGESHSPTPPTPFPPRSHLVPTVSPLFPFPFSHTDSERDVAQRSVA